MLSRFFIDRPIFAAVISLFLVLAGLAAMRSLPIAQYPEIAPPVVTVQAVYPGASAQTIEQTVASPIENAINGVPGMIYMSSSSGSNGVLQIQVTFDIGTNVDIATVNVNNRVNEVLPRLPEEVRRQGVSVERGSSAFLQVLAFYSPDDRFDGLFTSNYVTLNVLDRLKRLPGTTNVQIFGAHDYAMRIWLKPDRMAQLRLTPADIISAVNEQNAQFAAGKVGQSPTTKGQDLVYTVTTRGRLTEPKEFEQIIVRSNPDGSAVRLSDVARVELGSKDYEFIGRINGKSATLVGIFLSPGANALDVAKTVKTEVAELATRFPEGLAYSVPYDTTRFVEVSIREVLKTLGEAMLLVFLVVYLFLQSWRAAIIPFAAVPVSLIGAFAGIYALGYSINTLTLFAMVLAIGIVVDDAIVVLENVERHMREDKLPARDAAIKAMREVTGPIIAIVLTLTAVFVPIAFLGGLTGELYRQFAVTIAISVVISGLVALTLSPALCAIILKPHEPPNRFFAWFNDWFARVTARYNDGVVWMLRRGVIGALLFIGMVALTAWLWRVTPGSLVPDEDQGFYISAVILPDGATLERTDKVVVEGDGGDPLEPEQPGHHRVHRLRLHRRRLPQQRGDDLRHAKALGRAHRHGAAARRRAVRQDRRHQGSAGARVQSAADLRPRNRGRLRVLHPEPRRRRREAPVGGHAAVPRARQPGSATRGGADAVARDGAAAHRRRRPREGEDARHPDLRRICRAVGDARQLLRQRLQQVRSRMAGADVGRADATAIDPTTSAPSMCARPRAR